MKRAVIEALLSGDYHSQARKDLAIKNLLQMGVVSPTFVADIVRASKGSDYKCSPLYGSQEIVCHVIKSRGWYVKFYFMAPDTVFISVHK